MAKFGDHPPIPDALENLLSDLTVSTVFLKADCPPRVKRGHITELEVVELEMEKFSSSTIEEISQGLDITLEQHSETRGDCFVEIERVGCTILQIGDLRVTCASPPFSEVPPPPPPV